MEAKIYRTARDGRRFNIDVKLSDDCHNGHQDFSITGAIYEAGKPKIERNMIVCGAIGNRIAEEFPDLAIFDTLHLCDFKGAPMYAVENGFYHIKQMDAEEFCEYFRCTQADWEKLSTAENKEHFAMLLYLSEIPTRWKQEADCGIQILEGMTGEKWVNSSIKSNFIAPTPEQIADFETKQKAGYFSSEQRMQREKAAYDAYYKKEREKGTRL